MKTKVYLLRDTESGDCAVYGRKSDLYEALCNAANLAVTSAMEMDFEKLERLASGEATLADLSLADAARAARFCVAPVEIEMDGVVVEVLDEETGLVQTARIDEGVYGFHVSINGDSNSDVGAKLTVDFCNGATRVVSRMNRGDEPPEAVVFPRKPTAEAAIADALERANTIRIDGGALLASWEYENGILSATETDGGGETMECSFEAISAQKVEEGVWRDRRGTTLHIYRLEPVA